MTIKKLMFCILCFANAANLATDEDFNNKNSSNFEVEENVLINKNSLNTRKWGNIYFLFPHLSILNIIIKNDDEGLYFNGEIGTGLGKLLNFIVSGVIEYKYMFHKYCGINVRLNINNFELLGKKNLSFFSLETSLEWIYGRKGKHIFSGSFSPLGFAWNQKDDGNRVENFWKEGWTLGFMLLKYEYDRRFYLNFWKVKTAWYWLKDIKDNFSDSMGWYLLSIEFGLNIIGVNDWRKKRKENIEI